MFDAVYYSIENDLDEKPDEVTFRFFNEEQRALVVRFSDKIVYESEYGEPFDDTVSLAEDFLRELASRLGYRVTR